MQLLRKISTHFFISHFHLQEAFLMNQISGRRLVLIDCSALNQMGMTDLFEMKVGVSQQFLDCAC